MLGIHSPRPSDDGSHRFLYLTDEEIIEYIRIVKEAFGKELTFEQGKESALRYLHLLEMLARRPHPKNPSDQAETA